MNIKWPLMLRRILLFILLLVVFGFTTSPSYAGTFFDNFDDGNADGWWLGYSQHTPWVNGNWRVENGELVQDQAGDNFIALVENIQVSNQSTETKLKINGPSGYGGITIWYQNPQNWLNIFIYPAIGKVLINENIDNASNSFEYPYTFGDSNTWYNLKVNANSTNGELKIYINNGYLFTHSINTPNRTGQSGVNNGNAGGYFDDFKIISDDIPPINVSIDIKPFNKNNPIQYKSRGIIPVAIISTENFDAANQIDQKTLTFGATGNEKSLAFCNRRPKNIRRDNSKDDLICYFFINIANFKCGDTEGILRGKTINGISIEGKDLVKINGCKNK